MKATITAVLYTSKKLANGEHPVMLRVSYNGKRSYKATGVACNKKYWNEKKEVISKGYPNYEVLNTIIQQKKNELITKELEYKVDGSEYSASKLLSDTKEDKKSNLTVQELIREQMNHYKTGAGAVNTWKGFQSLLNQFNEYTNNKPIELFDFTEELVKGFELYIRNAGLSDNTLLNRMSKLRTVTNKAIKKKIIKPNDNPFISFDFEKKLNLQTKKKALQLNEINTLIEYYFRVYYWHMCNKTIDNQNMLEDKYVVSRYLHLGIKNNKFEYTSLSQDDKDSLFYYEPLHYWHNYFLNKPFVLDSECFTLCAFLLGYMMQGLAMVDLAKLKFSDLKEYEVIDKEQYEQDLTDYGAFIAEQKKKVTKYYYIETTRQKTGVPVSIYIEQNLFQRLIKPIYHHQIEFNGQDNFILPIYSIDMEDSKDAKFKKLEYAIAVANKRIKQTAKKFNYDSDITFYSERHTFASTMRWNMVDNGLIAQMMGRSEKGLERYLKEFDVHSIIEAKQKMNKNNH